ncbi:MAG: AAA family ATPase [Deltaproteobacteria bacterium]|nr:AAA family ATPase [Deltaproteobacteria bacterium]
MKSLALFNNKGGVGKTTLTFNIAHMAARQGLRTLILDYDPQCNVSAIALSEESLFEIWENASEYGTTVARCIDLVRRGKGDIVEPRLEEAADDLWILPGDLALSRFEQALAEGWGQIHASDNERAMHVTTALQRLADRAARSVGADLVLLDVGPNLGALNRAALLAADAVVVPVAPDLFSLQGLKNVGPTMREWRLDWERAQERTPGPSGARSFEPRGYIVQQHLARVDRPVRGYEKWAAQIPGVFHEQVLETPERSRPARVEDDPYCVTMLKHFASLVPLAQLVRKPIFDLKQADGVGGGQIQAVAKARIEFEQLTGKLRALLGI